MSVTPAERRPIVSVADFDLSDYDFWARPMREREHAFQLLRGLERPVFYREPEIDFAPPGPGYHALVRHADILEASRHPEVFCSGDGGATNIPDMPPEFTEYFGSMINMDDPRHARLRRIVSRAFTPKMIKQFEADVDAAASKIVDDLLAKGPGCDFVAEVAARLPLKIICDMMGIPEKDYGFVFDRSNIILGGFDPEYGGDDMTKIAERLLTAGLELNQLVQDLAAHRAEHPTDDLTSSLVNANIDGENLTAQELGSFFILLVVAGNETTRNAISYGLRLLTRNPDQRALWLSDIDGHAPGAVEEIVRLAAPVNFMRRKLTRDHEMNGTLYREGEKVVLYYWSANRDEAVFTDPLRFDILRTEGPHVGFGGPGPHFCLGAHLARREITVMFRELLRRVPQIEGGSPERLYSSFINGIKHMECRF
ncbi:cytochrome P450 [Planobispora longispora]|uniref:Linalool 8-monooxygenase n=1 Tax=Planobispora longispora TaxID=28887 RepID=A0A8J3RRA2_9ACTN|nr:cytochrome P450 [Planobispora longispora]BFE81948.1 cytochrome P450 [Planobispora longispora]GIH79330.1 linalool 8-monooxygenase [Planobispora longispora]